MKFRKPKFYYCELWRMNYWFCIGWPPKMFERYLKEEFDYDIDLKGNDGRIIEASNDGTIIMIMWVRNPKDLCSIVHECVHAANWTLDHRGWKHDPNNDEPQAYLVDGIFRQAIKGIRR